MPEKIIFTEARVKSLHPPETGRKYIYDAKTAGLAVCVTANGSKTWYVYRWAAGRPVRIRLGKYQTSRSRPPAKRHRRQSDNWPAAGT